MNGWQAFAGPNSYPQSVFLGGNRARVLRIVEAIGVVGEIEVHFVAPGGVAFYVQVSTPRVRLGPRGPISEGNEEGSGVVGRTHPVRRERDDRWADRETKLPGPMVATRCPAADAEDDGVPRGGGRERKGREAEPGVGLEVT